MKIGITGATGQLGSLVIDHLKSKTAAENIVALVRNQEKAAGLGVESRAFDYNDSGTLKQSLSGIDYLLLISSSEVGQRSRQHKNVIQAAKEAGVKWIVYTSLLHADTSTLSLAGEHLETEALLKEAGIPVTILRNGWYTENYLGSVDSALKAGAFIGSAGEGKISSAARNDFAEAAAVVITDPQHQGKVYELAGDESYTLSDLAKEISKEAGKEIPYNNLEESQYAGILESVGVPAGFAQAIAGWDVSASKGDLFDDSKTLSKLIQRPTTPMSESVVQTLG
ncbi:SDR family oxidoreductase [Algoriphagus sp. PAP.12]|uniref:SDR family oxidoreductase n=1 Tax=Algoriphagus sp. PAP.12 TaxID=2996678 RepID=UPI00227A8A63|nr:SDR family oxidoreductase [Algoriphagus sp. PAP.12]